MLGAGEVVVTLWRKDRANVERTVGSIGRASFASFRGTYELVPLMKSELL